MKAWKITILFLLLMALVEGALASPGGTDANGGHYNHTTGLYHYHHGYPEHQHENGICPYTGEVWELNIPEKPATLAEWEAQKHEKDELPGIDNITPENEDWKKGTTRSAANASSEGNVNVGANAVGVGSAVALAGGVAVGRKRKKKNDGAEAKAERKAEKTAEAPKPAETGENLANEEQIVEKVEEPQVDPLAMPEGTIIGDDGLPWEKEAYERELARRKTNGNEHVVPTNFAEPKWGKAYSFCVDEDGEEIHTMDCKLSFIQINAADPFCPKKDCEICHPVRPDLRWYEAYKARKQQEEKKA